MYRICVAALTVASCLVWQMVVAQEPEYSDADIKEKYAFISCLIHGDENGSHIRKALRMAETAGTDPKKALFFSAFLMSARPPPLVWASFAGFPPGGDP